MLAGNFENLNVRFTSDEANNSCDCETLILSTVSHWEKKSVAQYVADVDSIDLVLRYLNDCAARAEGLNVEIWFDSSI